MCLFTEVKLVFWCLQPLRFPDAFSVGGRGGRKRVYVSERSQSRGVRFAGSDGNGGRQMATARWLGEVVVQ